MNNKDALLLVSRLIIGGIFIFSGWMKVSDMPTTIGFFASVGIPAVLAYVVAYAEVLGGLAIVLGLWTKLAASGLVIIMLGAIYFAAKIGGFQMAGLPLVTLAGLLSLIASGAGSIALKKSSLTTN